GPGKRALLPAQTRLAGLWGDAARGYRRAHRPRSSRSGAAEARAGELFARGARRRRRRRDRRRGAPGPRARLSRRRRHSSLTARRRAAVSRAPRIYISAGEPSGDAHAAAVVAALRRRFPGVELEAFGGPLLERAGATVLDRMEAFSVVGFVEA